MLGEQGKIQENCFFYFLRTPYHFSGRFFKKYWLYITINGAEKQQFLASYPVMGCMSSL